jgi:hypothetical protein
VHPPPSPARTDFTLITECTPESSGCNATLCTLWEMGPQPGHVQRFCVIPVVRLSPVGPSSFDCVYNFSQASSQHKYTVTSHLAYDNIHITHGPELPCVAGTLPPMTDGTERPRFFVRGGEKSTPKVGGGVDIITRAG